MMKRANLFFIMLAVIFISTAFSPKDDLSVVNERQDKIELPDNVKAIVENKCMGCHKPDARNEKAREKLQWVKVPDMNLEEQEHFIAEMFEVLEEGKMPPARMVERFPERKLTDEETKILLSWVEAEEKRLKGQ